MNFAKINIVSPSRASANIFNELINIMKENYELVATNVNEKAKNIIMGSTRKRGMSAYRLGRMS